MIVIVGLGNPGEKYKKTRHNVGFDVIDLLAEKYQIDVQDRKYKALVGKGRINTQAVLLVKPQTFMNLSGESVGEILRFYKLDPEQDLLVISDDVTLEPGMIRIRRKGSAGGHNGLKNIIAHSGTDGFMRIKVGVGKLPPQGDMVAHVLGRFSEADRKQVEGSYQQAVSAVEYMIDGKIDQAMNLFNRKVEK